MYETTMTPVPLTLTPEQAAARLGIKEWRIRKLVREGVLKGVRTGGTEKYPRGMRVTEESLRAYRDSLPAYAERGVS